MFDGEVFCDRTEVMLQLDGAAQAFKIELTAEVKEWQLAPDCDLRYVRRNAVKRRCVSDEFVAMLAKIA